MRDGTRVPIGRAPQELPKSALPDLLSAVHREGTHVSLRKRKVVSLEQFGGL